MSKPTAGTTGRDMECELAFFAQALKAPALRDAAARLAERAKAEGWPDEEYPAACLQREVAARDAHGAEGRIRAARFPSRKSLEDFDFDHQRSVKAGDDRTSRKPCTSSPRRRTWFLGPPGTPAWPGSR
ncbi:ATP-binding protein [Streptomyces sp. NPDC052013]|uniref:ATP-binding protein n=1 Tax=Streptomyces sp. NPDC052013 TaxID=3365679 RepID=UPI0037D2AF6B